ncbi:MAG: alpha/beta hydrolase [Gammaproteobacteria bacterium]|nr:alpha/beta hydrolase [Gammaproteobacteria bacterium]
MNRYLKLTAFFLGVTFIATTNAQQPAFNSEEETVEGWYHSHDFQTWLTKGAELDVIQSVLANIERSQGAKRIAEFIDTQIEYAPGNWAYEWIQAGDTALAEARSMSGANRLAKLRAALTYYSTGSWPHLGRADDSRALEKAIATYLEAGEMMNVPVSHVELTVGQVPVNAYLHQPAGDGPFPFVINTFGSDVTKEDSFDLFHRELEPRGIGMLAVDMPGIGEARDLSMLNGSDQVLEAALVYLQGYPGARQDRIFVVGGSFGGNAAARAFYRLDVAGVVSMCAPLHSPFIMPPEALDQLPNLTIDGVKARFGLLDRMTSELSPLLGQTSLEVQGLMDSGNIVETPLLVISTNRDPVSPLDDLAVFLDSATDKESVILDIEGHCPPRWVREPMVARWVADQVRELDAD